MGLDDAAVPGPRAAAPLTLVADTSGRLPKVWLRTYEASAVELTDTFEIKVNEITNVAFGGGRGRLPRDVSSEVLDSLGDVCRMVVCDLGGLAAAGVASIVRAFTPVGCYLRAWHGTALVVYVPDTALRQALFQALVDERILVSASLVSGTVEARAVVPRLDSVTALLPPWPSTAPEARRIALHALTDWEADDLADASALVTSELVTNAVVHAQTPLQLTMVHADDQVRLAVRDRGGGRAATGDRARASSLNGRGLALVDAYSSSWGVLPARRSGKTVWAVLDRATQRQSSLSRSA